MQHRPSTASERTSIGMEVVAVAVGLGYGAFDSITRRVHRHDDDPPASGVRFDHRADRRGDRPVHRAHV